MHPSTILLTVSAALALSAVTAHADALHPSHRRGFYDAPFDLTLTTDIENGAIRFTTDGSTPDPSTGTLYENPLPITSTTVVRSITYDPSAETTASDTHTYIFADHVENQEPFPAGYIAEINSARNGASRPHTFDWGFDRDVLDDEANNGILAEHLKDLPALALSMDVADFNFVYRNHSRRGERYERPVSIELIYPDDNPAFEKFRGFQEHCGIRMHGGGAVDQARKKSFRLLFKESYGTGKLDYPLFESAVHHARSAVDRFDGVVLRAAGNTNWSKDDAWKHEPSTYLRDSFTRDSQIAVTGFGSRSNFAHLFLNGLYFGLYNIAERPDDKFMASYFGGQREDYYSINHGGAVAGNATSWNAITRSTNLRRLDTDENYRRVASQIDLVSYCDYIILNWCVGMGDWPWNNFYAGVKNTPDGRIRFFNWDSEYAFWTIPGYLRSNPGAWANPNFQTENGVISTVWRALARNRDFLLMFADRVHAHTSSGGPLSDAGLTARFQRLADHIEGPIVAESAKWGDSAWGRENTPHTRAGDFYPNVTAVLNLIDGNTAKFITALRRARYYPNIDPPVLTSVTGLGTTTTTLTNPNAGGEIYITTDGSDPRTQVTGDVSPTASAYLPDTPLNIAEPTRIMSRVLQGSIWSALEQHLTLPPNAAFPVRISELMYHPTSSEAFEFIELENPTGVSIDLSNFSLEGISFRFPPGTTLAPESLLVLAPDDDPAQFASRYPNLQVAGFYRGHLDNSGETITLLDPQGTVVTSVTYNDSGRWPATADGGGSSLELTSTTGDPNSPDSWRASPTQNGTPGTAPDPAPTDSDGDGFPDAVEILAGTDPQDPTSFIQLDARAHPDSSVLLTFEAAPNRPYTIHFNPSLSDPGGWQPLTSFPPATSTTTQQFIDTPTAGQPQRHYRLSTPGPTP
ncbi:MAG: lamin tail domain-containing protein [Verrucomicrobiales bacterium]|nr:lamin tail domain-containing protein [Verrucomicrobiales bacterium]